MGEPPARIIPNDNLHRLADLIKHHREELLATWRQEIRRLPAARNLDVPTLNDNMPGVLDELADALIAGQTESVMDLQLQHSPKVHGTERLRVVDASVFPRAPGLFIVSAIYMIGEKAADAILADAR